MAYFNADVVSNLGAERVRSISGDIAVAQVGFEAGDDLIVSASGCGEPSTCRLGGEAVEVGCIVAAEGASILNGVHRRIRAVRRLCGLRAATRLCSR